VVFGRYFKTLRRNPAMDAKNAAIAVAFVTVCLLAGAIGSIFTFPSITGWYAGLNKPFFSPPNWVFGPVWTILYVLMGVAAYLVFMEGKTHETKSAMAAFAVQLILNVLWSVLFFGMHSPLLGLLCIAALWVSIAITIREFMKVSRTAGLLLIPYIAWVSFAALLNAAVFLLN
jgi:tryptophan-rich sensory protein